MRARLLTWLVGLLALLPAQAFAAFHLMKVVEVFPGTAAAPNAQYVVIQMYAGGQNFVNGHKISVFGPNGGAPTVFTFNANVSSGTNQAKILIATTEAQSFFGVTANLTMQPVIQLAGGKVCFDALPEDCVTWGSVLEGNAPGTQFPEIKLGKALKRKLNIAGGANTLEASDDTNKSNSDFFLDLPTPKNNAGVTGTIPSSSCGNNSLEGLEGCDDGNIAFGDGCDQNCEVENCGNGVVDQGEDCDDSNDFNTDACLNNCQDAICGDSFIRAGVETCDDGNNVNGDGCDAACQVEVPQNCGNATPDLGEECDDGNNVSGDGCSANCLLEVCGDGIVNNGEACDDGNTTAGDGCSDLCVNEQCGDGVLQVGLGEECDDNNLIDGDGCNANCSLPFCGNSIVDPGEGCDDGNEDPEDGCDPVCVVESCGDGFVQVGLGESCDDGNTTAGDGCDAACAVENNNEEPVLGGGLCSVVPAERGYGALLLLGLGLVLGALLRTRRSR